MTTVLVWVLIVSVYSTTPTQLGNYATLADCQRVQQSYVLKNKPSQCVQVNLVISK